MPEMKVVKRDGSEEDFDRMKISGSVVKAGGTQEQGENIADQVVTWAKGVAIDGKVKTTDIGEKVLELLRPVNPEAADAYEAYRQSK